MHFVAKIVNAKLVFALLLNNSESFRRKDNKVASKLESRGSVRCRSCNRFVHVVSVDHGNGRFLQIGEHYPNMDPLLSSRQGGREACPGSHRRIGKSEVVDIS